MISCDNCGHAYDGTRHRWLCPHCKWKSSCCEGAPCPPLDSPAVVDIAHLEQWDCPSCHNAFHRTGDGIPVVWHDDDCPGFEDVIRRFESADASG